MQVVVNAVKRRDHERMDSRESQIAGYRLRARKLKRFADKIGEVHARRQLMDLAALWETAANSLQAPSTAVAESYQSVERSRALLGRLSKKGL